MRIDLKRKKRRSPCSGQAAVEFAIGIFIFALLIAAFTELSPVMLGNLQLLSRARTDAGLDALGAISGTPASGGAAEGAIVNATGNGFAPDAPADPWSYPGTARAGKENLEAWRYNRIRALETHAGFTYEPYRLDFLSHFGVEDAEHKIHEEVRLPPMQGL